VQILGAPVFAFIVFPGFSGREPAWQASCFAVTELTIMPNGPEEQRRGHRLRFSGK